MTTKPKTTTKAALEYERKKNARARKAKRASLGISEAEGVPGEAERRYQTMVEHKAGMQQQRFGFVPDRPSASAEGA
jgi:hypothetical protein